MYQYIINLRKKFVNHMNYMSLLNLNNQFSRSGNQNQYWCNILAKYDDKNSKCYVIYLVEVAT